MKTFGEDEWTGPRSENDPEPPARGEGKELHRKELGTVRCRCGTINTRDAGTCVCGNDLATAWAEYDYQYGRY